jgi:nucleoid-associated protein YgaU
MYKMYFGINNGEEGFILPVLPEKVEFSENGDNKTYNVINLGEVNTINPPKLMEINFESFFPQNMGPYVSSEQLFEPSFYITKIKDWREKRLKVRFIFVGGTIQINDLFTIENFKYSESGGEVGDIYYSIEIKRYKKYSAKKVTVVSSNARDVDKSKVKTHTVVWGDTMWLLAKRYLGSGDRYPEIFILNTDIVQDPNTIHPGQVLRLP